ncbi:MAG: hypothetical protein ABSE91_03900 [Patescibacteria group bacterium]|jgi:Tol biopolymer transport system component
MKKLTWLLFLGYYCVFIILGVIFYFKYLNIYLVAGAKPAQISAANTPKIYYSAKSSFFRVDPNYINSGALINSSDQIQSGGAVESLEVSPNEQTIAISVNESSGLSQVQLLEISSNQLQTISNSKLKDFNELSDPHFSPNSKQLAFLAMTSSREAIFIEDLAKNTFTDLIDKGNVKIADFSWNRDGSKIVFCTAGGAQNACSVVNTSTGKVLNSFSAEVKQISWSKTAAIFYLGSANNIANIYTITENSSISKPVTNIGSPKTVTNFDLDSQGRTLVYEVDESNNSDVYVSRTDGSNLIQLTTDQKSSQPIISPDGQTVAFLRQADGIYTIGIDKTKESKLLNLTENINHLLTWK